MVMNSSDNSVEIIQNLAHTERTKSWKIEILSYVDIKHGGVGNNMSNQISKSRGKFIFEKVVTE